MTDAELIAWAACQGWGFRRGGGMVELIRPDGREYDVMLDARDMPILDEWQRREIAQARRRGPVYAAEGCIDPPTGEPGKRPE